VKLDLGANKSSLYAVVHPDEEIRTAAEECEQGFSKLGTDISVSRPLYEALGKLDVGNEDDVTRRWKEKLLRDFRRAGVDKDEQDGKIRLTTDYPDYIPFARYAHTDARRKEFAIMFRDRGYPANKGVLNEILAKRFELAQLLGYDNYADYITEDKMVKSADNAQAFMEKIVTAARPRSDQDYAVLLERLRKIDPDATRVGSWQSSYVSDIVRRE
jgi:thimet oligopeptidase